MFLLLLVFVGRDAIPPYEKHGEANRQVGVPVVRDNLI
jgi:hypothetical protein